MNYISKCNRRKDSCGEPDITKVQKNRRHRHQEKFLGIHVSKTGHNKNDLFIFSLLIKITIIVWCFHQFYIEVYLLMKMGQKQQDTSILLISLSNFWSISTNIRVGSISWCNIVDQEKQIFLFYIVLTILVLFHLCSPQLIQFKKCCFYWKDHIVQNMSSFWQSRDVQDQMMVWGIVLLNITDIWIIRYSGMVLFSLNMTILKNINIFITTGKCHCWQRCCFIILRCSQQFGGLRKWGLSYCAVPCDSNKMQFPGLTLGKFEKFLVL